MASNFLDSQLSESLLAQFPGGSCTRLSSLLQLRVGLAPPVVRVGDQDNHIVIGKWNTGHLFGTEEEREM